MVLSHQHRREEGPARPLLPQEAETFWHGLSNPQKPLQLYHRDGCITIWYENCTALNLKALQTVVEKVPNFHT